MKVKKVWDTAQVKIKPKWYVARKKHKEDFLLLTEKELINLCNKLDLSTQKANGEEYNNKEKRYANITKNKGLDLYSSTQNCLPLEQRD